MVDTTANDVTGLYRR